MSPVEPSHSIEIRRLLLAASRENGTVEAAPAWMGGVIAYGVHHPFATINQWLNGQHVSSYKPMVNALRAHGQYDEAVALLCQLVACIDGDRSLVAPWFAEQLASIYMQHSRWQDALDVCESYTNSHPDAGAQTARLVSTAEKLRIKLGKRELRQLYSSAVQG